MNRGEKLRKHGRTEARPARKGRRLGLVLVLALLLVGGGVGTLAYLRGDGGPALPDGAGPGQAALPLNDIAAPEQPYSAAEVGTGAYWAIPLPDEMRAMWISFQELEGLDLASEPAAAEAFGQVFEECRGLGLNTVIVMVRPYSDALYRSALFPFSHIINGTQGHDPGFDPLEVMVREAHARDLRIEAWVIPYKISQSWSGPHSLSDDNPASKHPEWVVDIGGDLWYDPGIPEVRSLVRDGVLEIVQNYEVDGIHFDDYFSPDSFEGPGAFDAGSYAEHGGGAAWADWRRANNDDLVRSVYVAIKSANPSVSFGISPQGDSDVNYHQEYSDVGKWMAKPGYIDYVMPQLYEGFAHRTPDGSDASAFENAAATWAASPRDASVRLYAGLGAYRVGLLQADGSRFGFGDYGSNDQSEWESGRNLADMVSALRSQEGYAGFALFRHAYLFQPGDPLSQGERTALEELLGQAPG